LIVRGNVKYYEAFSNQPKPKNPIPASASFEQYLVVAGYILGNSTGMYRAAQFEAQFG
jgi:hypothetical protein